MQSEKCGKKITNISFLKKEVVITFDDETKIKLSLNTFSNFYLYKDKKLTLEEEKELLFENDLSKFKSYVLNLFSKKMYSEKEIIEKLKNKKCNRKVIEAIISYLKDHQFIDDKKYLSYLVEEYNNKKYGKHKIVNLLTSKGISSLLIDEIIFDEDEELSKASALVEEYLKQNKNKSFLALKKSLYGFLVTRGYSNNIASKALESALKVINKDDEREILLKSLEKYVIIHQMDLNDAPQREKLINKYLSKGFNYNLIKEVLEEIWKN